MSEKAPKHTIIKTKGPDIVVIYKQYDARYRNNATEVQGKVSVRNFVDAAYRDARLRPDAVVTEVNGPHIHKIRKLRGGN